MRSRWIAVAGVLALAAGVVACGDDDEGGEAVQRQCSTGLPDSSAWEGDTFVNASKGGGTIAVGEFNEFLATAEPPLSTSPCDAARVFLKLDQRQSDEGIEFQVKAVPIDPGDEDSANWEVEITLANLADDSILAERWNFRFGPAEGDSILIADAVRTQSCQPGRGHAAFTPKPCV